MILRPQQNFTIVRQLARPLEIDPTVFYVRAVIRNAYSDETLATLNLTDQGNNRFTKTWQVANDPGNGMYVSITTSVYEDSGYTTKSSVYGDEEATYQIERQKLGGGGGIGWVPDKDFWEKLAKAVAENMTAIFDEKFKLPKQKEFDLGRIERAITAIPQITDYATAQDIQGLATAIKSAIEAAKPKEPDPVNLEPVTEAINETQRQIADVLVAFGEAFKKIEAVMKIGREGTKQDVAALSDAIKKIESAAETLGNHLKMTTPIMMMGGGKEETPRRERNYSLR